MNTSFVKVAEALPSWMSQPAGLFQRSGELFDGADTGGSGLAVAHLCHGGAGNPSGISQQSAFFPSHAGQRALDGFKVHSESPLTDSLTEDGYLRNQQYNHIRINVGGSIYPMPISTPSRIVRAKNLNRLMDATLSLNSNTKMVKQSKLGLGTIGRVRNAEVDATIDTLDKLAECFGIEPWQLLAPPDAVQPPPAALPLIEYQPAHTPMSERAQELGVLFDLLAGRDGKIDQAEVFAAATEAISRTVTGRQNQPTGTPAAPVPAKTRDA